MRLGANRDVDDADARAGRRRHYHAESRDWYAPDDVAPYSLPHRTRAEGVQRPDEKTMRGYERGSMSLDTSQPTMQPPHLGRSSTDAYRRPADIVVYEDEENTPEDWRRSGRRPRTPEYRRPTHHAPEHRRPSPVSIQGPEDCDEAEIEVIEELDADQLRRLKRREQRRHVSRDEYQDSTESRRRRRKIIPSSSEDEEIEIRHRHSSPDRRSPLRRPVLRREVSDSPKYGAPRVSVIETTRPPVASKRSPQVYEREVYREAREARPRQATVNTTRQSRSTSRRPPSIIGSIFGSSSRLGSPERSTKVYECVVCMEEFPASKCAKLKCGHRRCNSCLKRQFKLSTNDPQHMPPTCCTSNYIPLRHVDKLFDLSFKKLWNRKFAEFSTRNRIYCPSRRCGEWIKPENIIRDRESGRKMARCEYCKTRVCVSCNGKWHYSKSCPRDEETARFLEQAKEQGWQRCYRCKSMVELKEGCNHMTCRCGAEFCMVCAAKWKNCDCPWFNYDSDDQLEDMNVPTPVSRREQRNGFPDDSTSRREVRESPRARPRPRQYDEDAPYRRPKASSDEAATRRMHAFGDDYDVYDPMGGVGDIVGIGNNAGHYMNDHYRRGVPEGPPGRPAFGRSNSARGYVAGVSKARGFRGGSMEARLADRFSDSRQGPGPIMEAPAPPPPPGPPHMSTTIMPPPMGMPPPLMPSGPPLAMTDRLYDMRGIIVERDPNEYGDEDSYGSHSSRGRKGYRSRGTDTPKSSTLAGLSGRGVGMGRVDVWRKFVEPGDPEGEIAAAALAAASA